MALQVGELFATIRADTSGFDKQVDESGRKFQSLGKVVGAGVKTLATSFAAVTTAGAAMGTAVFKIGADYNRLQQTSRAALTTLLGSAEAASAQMDKLDDFARNSPFAKQVFITAQQQLLGFGVEAERVIPIMDAVQQSVAAVGGGNEEVSQVTLALAQMQGQGRLTGQTLSQLGVYGIDAAKIIGEQMGKSGEEIRKLASKPGGIPVDKIWDPLTLGLMDAFGGATDGIKEQYDGAVDRIRGATRDIGSHLAAPFIDPMGGGRAVKWANDVANLLRAVEKRVPPLVDIVMGRLEPAFGRITPTLEKAEKAVNRWDLSKVNGQLDSLGRYAPLIAGTSAALFALGTTNLPILSQLGLTGINPVVAGIAALVATSPELRAVGRDFWQSLQPVLPILGELGMLTADVAMELLRTLAPALGNVADGAAPVIIALASGLSPALVTLLQAVVPVAEVAGTLASAIAALPTPVLLAVTAFVALRGLVGPITTGIRAMGTAFEFAQGHIAASRAVSQATGGQISTLGAAARGAAPAVRGLGTAMWGAFGGPVGLAIGAVTLAIGAYIQSAADARARTEAWKATLDDFGNTTERTTERINELIVEDRRTWLDRVFGNDMKTWEDSARKFGIAIDDVQGYLANEEDAVNRVNAAIDQYISEHQRGAAQRAKGDEADRWLESLDQERESLISVSDQTRRKAELDVGAKDATELHREAAQRLREELDQTADANMSAAEAALRLTEAHHRGEDAIKRVRDAEKNLKDVRDDGEATAKDLANAERELRDANMNLERSALATRDATLQDYQAKLQLNASYDELYSSLMEAREGFIAQRMAAGDTRREAEQLANQLGLFPGRVNVDWTMRGLGDALTATQRLNSTLNVINGRRVTASVAVAQYGQGMVATGGDVGAIARSVMQTRFAIGGAVRGPGTGTSDSVPATGPYGVKFRLSNGEHVWTAAEVKAAGGQSAMYAMRKAVLSGALGRADGGPLDLARSLDANASRMNTIPVPSGASRSSTGTAASAPVPMVIDGARLSGTLDLGGGLTGVIDARIVEHTESQDRRAQYAGGR